MIEKIKNLGNLPLVIVLIIVVIIAILLSIFKSQKSEEANADTKLSDTTKVEQVENEEKEEQQEEPNLDENVEEIVDETEEEEENVDAKYFIRVNYGQNVVTIYTKDANGEYTVPYKAMVCSTGTATPRSGTYTMPSGTYSRGTWGLMKGNVWAQYFTRIKGSILFHSVPYTERNKWSLEYWEYDKLGTAASLGCIRLTVENAKWIYNNCPAGTQVEFYTDSNPGPLVPETPQKISEEEEVRNWDPTDPDAANPWKTYDPDKEEEQEEPKQETTTKPTTTKPTTTKPSTTKPSTTTPTTPTPPEEDKTTNAGSENETPEENQGGETIKPDEENKSEENQTPEEVPGGETVDPDEGTVDEPETPTEDQENSSENSSEENTENNEEENKVPEGENQNTLTENISIDVENT